MQNLNQKLFIDLQTEINKHPHILSVEHYCPECGCHKWESNPFGCFAQYRKSLNIDRRFAVGEKAIWVNQYGLIIGVVTIESLDTQEDRPHYYITPNTAYWASVSELSLIPLPEGSEV